MRSDEEIKKDIVDELRWDTRVDASNVKVEVNKGAVSLEGEVPSSRAKTAADTDSMIIQGVRRVDNNLKIKYLTEDLPSDSDLKESVINRLIVDPDVNSENIDVDVANGIVTLTGSVDSYYDKIIAEQESANIIGVYDVINKLTVVPSQKDTEKLNDKAIAEDIVDSFERNPRIDIEDIDIEVEDGKVNLSGEVPNYYAKRDAINNAYYTYGVNEVDSSSLVVSYENV